ncbi:hypothetical protein ACH5RR_032673 [Cinchona calisaya]|uniref:Uncharacterized protein n=1 Tax=Cinchona calisaya TaxID=153742 RepID=A0ABD2YIU1_9GENT
MAGPRKRGQPVKRQLQDQQVTKAVEDLGGSIRSSSRSTNSNSSNFLTPSSLPVCHVGNDIVVQSQTFESHASANNDDIQTSEENQNASRIDTDVRASGLPIPERMGPTRNLSLSRKMAAKETLSIKVNDNIQRIVGKDSQYFITETGCIVQKLAKLDVAKWSKLVVEHRLDLYNLVTISIALFLFLNPFNQMHVCLID